MISKSDKTEFRSSLFRHLDGIVTAPTAYALLEKGVIDHFRDHKKADLHELSRLFKANEGYLNVALRVLSSQGWLLQKADNQEDAIEYELTSKGEIGIQYFHWYKEAAELLKYSEKFHPRKFEKAPFLLLESLFQHFKENFGASISEDEEVQSVQHQILSHIEGIIFGTYHSPPGYEWYVSQILYGSEVQAGRISQGSHQLPTIIRHICPFWLVFKEK